MINMIVTFIITIIAVGVGFYMGYLKRNDKAPEVKITLPEIFERPVKQTDDEEQSFYE